MLLVVAELLTCREFEDLVQVAEVDTDLSVPGFVKFTMRLLSHACKDACAVQSRCNPLQVSHSEQDRSLPEIHFMYRQFQSNL